MQSILKVFGKALYEHFWSSSTSRPAPRFEPYSAPDTHSKGKKVQVCTIAVVPIFSAWPACFRAQTCSCISLSRHLATWLISVHHVSWGSVYRCSKIIELCVSLPLYFAISNSNRLFMDVPSSVERRYWRWQSSGLDIPNMFNISRLSIPQGSIDCRQCGFSQRT